MEHLWPKHLRFCTQGAAPSPPPHPQAPRPPQAPGRTPPLPPSPLTRCGHPVSHVVVVELGWKSASGKSHKRSAEAADDADDKPHKTHKRSAEAAGGKKVTKKSTPAALPLAPAPKSKAGVDLKDVTILKGFPAFPGIPKKGTTTSPIVFKDWVIRTEMSSKAYRVKKQGWKHDRTACFGVDAKAAWARVRNIISQAEVEHKASMKSR